MGPLREGLGLGLDAPSGRDERPLSRRRQPLVGTPMSGSFGPISATLGQWLRLEPELDARDPIIEEVAAGLAYTFRHGKRYGRRRFCRASVGDIENFALKARLNQEAELKPAESAISVIGKRVFVINSRARSRRRST